jgi:hypothetical protein
VIFRPCAACRGEALPPQFSIDENASATILDGIGSTEIVTSSFQPAARSGLSSANRQPDEDPDDDDQLVGRRDRQLLVKGDSTCAAY